MTFPSCSRRSAPVTRLSRLLPREIPDGVTKFGDGGSEGWKVHRALASVIAY